MSDKQKLFEIVRDFGYSIMQMNCGEVLAVSVVRDSDRYFTMRSSNGNFSGLSETSNAIEKAFNVTRGKPDPRDARIKELESKVADLETEAVQEAPYCCCGECNL